MKELSVFIDESGDFGDYDDKSPYYVISLVFHDQSIDITNNIRELDRALADIGQEGCYIHTGPIIRREVPFKYMNREERNRVLRRLVTFSRKVEYSHKSFCVNKRDFGGGTLLASRLTLNMEAFFREHLEYFSAYDLIKIYYDNGQSEVANIIKTVFSEFTSNVEVKDDVVPVDYKMFQVADLVCSAKVMELKMEEHRLSRSELKFFGSERDLRKNLIKPVNAKEKK